MEDSTWCHTRRGTHPLTLAQRRCQAVCQIPSQRAECSWPAGDGSLSAGTAGPSGSHRAQPLDTSQLGTGAVGHAGGPCIRGGCPARTRRTEEGNRPQRLHNSICKREN